jgi:hypothetical protein
MNALYYGNLSKEFLPYLETENIFTEYVDEFSMNPFPNFYESLAEIKIIIDYQNKAENDTDWDKIKNFCFLWDSDLIGSLVTSLNRLEISFDENYIDYLSNISEELGALIIKLKNHYQRARPYQYAFYGNQNLNPYETYSGNTPAYPSGHACQSFFLCMVVAHRYENKRKELMKLAKNVMDSRLIMGVHFPSDNEFGFHIAKKLLEKENIKQMYLK